ncbi:hypothetical protein ACLB2K_013959 [Fragaria x ananassa]
MVVTPVIAMVPNQYKYTIRVRVSRLWRPRFNNTDAYDDLHYVLVDEDGDSIHAFINEDQHDDYIKKVQQGQVYEICRFTTHLADPRASRVLHNDMVVHFYGPTEFVRIDDAPPIPQQSFQLIEFEDVEIERQNKEALTGKFQISTPHEQPLQTTKKAVTKCEVIVHNLRETLKITLWGDIAKPFDGETLQKLTQPVLAVFTSLNLDTYNEHVVASNSDHTCVFFNPTVPMEDDYITEFSRPGNND